MLSQAIRRLGKPSVAMPGFAVGRLGSVLRQARVADFSPEQLGFLTYGRGVDTTRMRAELGFEPRFTTASAFADFGVSLGVPLHVPDEPALHRRRTMAESERPQRDRAEGAESSPSVRRVVPVAGPARSAPPPPPATSPPSPQAATTRPDRDQGREADPGPPGPARTERRADAARRRARGSPAPSTTEETHPLAGIPVGDWLARLPGTRPSRSSATSGSAGWPR